MSPLQIFISWSARLQETDFGIICLTPENVSAPWLLFEAGALARAADDGLWPNLETKLDSLREAVRR